MRETRVLVRRERPTALAWSIALAVTMLAVYALTWTAARPEAARVSATPRVTREIELKPLEGWCVTLGTWEDAGSARVEAAGCAARGAAGWIYETEDGWQVLGALYDRETQARRVAKKLIDDEGIEADVLPVEASRLSLRVTAPESQLELLEAADALLCEQAAQLGDMAIQMEKGKLQPEAARTLCALTATEAASLSEKLNVFPGATDNAWCAALTGRLQALSEQLNAISTTRQTSPVALAGMLRLAQIDAFMGVKGVREALGSGG